MHIPTRFFFLPLLETRKAAFMNINFQQGRWIIPHSTDTICFHLMMYSEPFSFHIHQGGERSQGGYGSWPPKNKEAWYKLQQEKESKHSSAMKGRRVGEGFILLMLHIWRCWRERATSPPVKYLVGYQALALSDVLYFFFPFFIYNRFYVLPNVPSFYVWGTYTHTDTHSRTKIYLFIYIGPFNDFLPAMVLKKIL